MTSLVLGFDGSTGKAAEDSTGSFQSRLDALQNLTTGMIGHSVSSRGQAQSIRAPVASSTVQRIRLNQSTGTRVLK